MNNDVTDERFEFIVGNKQMYATTKRGPFEGFTVLLKRPHSTTYVYFEDSNEAWDTIKNHCDNYDKFVQQDARKEQ